MNRPMRRSSSPPSSEAIRAEIIDRFGFLPPFFEPALTSPQVAENLWRQTVSAYIDNPIPDLFKEKLAALLARYCTVPYCMICHSATLRPLGMQPSDILTLLEQPALSFHELEEKFTALAPKRIDGWPEPGSDLEESILSCCVAIFLHQESTVCHTKLREILTEDYYNHLIIFIAYNRTALSWAEAHPELAYEADVRVKEHLEPLLQSEPKLAAFFANYRGRLKEQADRYSYWLTRTAGKMVQEERSARAAAEQGAAQIAALQEQLTQAIEVSGIAFYDWNIGKGHLLMSEKFKKDWGLEDGATLQDAIDLVLPEDRPRVEKQIEIAMRDCTPYAGEHRIRRRTDGQVLWLEARGKVEADERGKPIRFFGTSVDISHRKNLEADALAVANSIPQLAWMADGTGYISWYNRRWYEYTGTSAAEMAGWGWQSVHHPDEVDRVTAKYKKHIASGESWEDTFPLRSADGVYRWFLSRAEPIRDFSGRIIRWFGTNTDVTEHRKNEELLARFAAVIQSSTDFILMSDADFHPTFINRAGRVLSGFGDRDIHRANIWDFFPEDERNRLKNEILPLVANNKSWEGELEIQHFETNARIPVHYNLFPVMGRHEGQILGYATVTRDITERKQGERRLVEARDAAEQANRAKSAFLVNMSHEIRTPLGAIMGFAELLKNPKLNRPDLTNYATIIGRNSQHLLRIVDDILDLSKVEAGKMAFERIDVQLPAFLADIASLFGQHAREKNIGFELNYGGPIPEIVRTDPTRLRQIVANIVSNAIKFTSSGYVELCVTYAHGRLEFRVTDTGCGISEQQFGKLFKVFSQADDSTSRQFGGTGLGLVLSRRLAAAMGGDLVLERSELGVGSVFMAHVKAEVPAGTSFVRSGAHFGADTRYERVGTDRLVGKRILVVDDVPDNRTLMSVILREQGAEVHVASDAYVALEMTMSNSYELVFLDIQMPGMDGYQVNRVLSERNPRMPVIAITAHAMEEERERAKLAGFAGFVTKPVDRETLVGAAERILGSAARSSSANRTCDVMIVEDDADIRKLFGQIIEENGHTSVAASSAREAFDLLERGIRPHIILLDLSLPDLPGSEVVHQIRSRSDWRDIRIAIVSGWDQLEQRARQLGVDAALRKPVDLVSFENLLKRFVPDFPKAEM